MKVAHADLSKVTRMVLVDVRSVVVLATSHTTTTWVLSVLAYTTVAGGDMAATRRGRTSVLCFCAIMSSSRVSLGASQDDSVCTYCFLVLLNRVGILSV